MKKSHFLFGARQTGKTHLVKSHFGEDVPIINLLRSDIYRKLIAAPWEIDSLIAAKAAQPKQVVIDEVQRVPELLNEVQRLIEEEGIKFLLTGSSARKLKQRDINLLGGRARQAQLFPLAFPEIPDFDLNRYLHYGGLPAIYNSDDPVEDLIAYVDVYLKDEIQVETMVRRIDSFSRFLTNAAIMNGQLLNYSAYASDCGISVHALREYYQILEDTLIGFNLEVYKKTKKRKAAARGKFYLFDVGVSNQLAGIKTLDPLSNLYDHAFEHFIAMELKAFLSYNRIHEPLTFWHDRYGNEVDFIIGDLMAIEVKSASTIGSRHLKGLKILQEENIFKKYILICCDTIHQIQDNIEIIHWQTFLNKLWNGEYELLT